MMKPDIKQKWLTALRSGNYKQAKGTLADKMGGFCCLGVLCESQELEHPVYHNDREKSEYIFEEEAVPMGGLLNMGFLDHVGMTDDFQLKLSNMNDSGASFSEIADWIEKNL